MRISERQAADRLLLVGVSYRQARTVLASGLAGEPLRAPSASLYDEEAVAALAARPVLTEHDVEAACPWGLFVARSEPDPWWFSPYAAVWIRSRIEKHGHLPFVATVCGFVARGAEITAVLPQHGGGYRLEVRDPGPWYDTMVERRLQTGRGRPWVLVGWDRARVGN